MLFKLSFRNMKKSFKDYAIYFLTLVLGVAIFYMFNSLDSQQAMLEASQSTKSMIQLMIQLIGMISVFIAIEEKENLVYICRLVWAEGKYLELFYLKQY